MKKCPKCGKNVPDNMPVCPTCGTTMPTNTPVKAAPTAATKPAPAAKPVSAKPVAQPAVQPAAKPAEKPVVAPVAPKAEPNNQVVAAPVVAPAPAPVHQTNLVPFYKHVRKFKSIHCFFAYFFKLLYCLGILVMLAAPIMVPFISTADAPEQMDLFAMNFEHLTSVFAIVMTQVNKFASGGGIMEISCLAGLILPALLYIPAFIWAVAKTIRCFILVLFACCKKKRVVMESLAKVQHKEYDFGMLGVDKLYFFSLITVVLFMGLCLIQTLVPASAGFTQAYNIFQSKVYLNFGTVCIVGAIAVSTLLGLLFLMVRGIVKKKVKKHFGLTRKQQKKLNK